MATAKRAFCFLCFFPKRKIFLAFRTSYVNVFILNHVYAFAGVLCLPFGLSLNLFPGCSVFFFLSHMFRFFRGLSLGSFFNLVLKLRDCSFLVTYCTHIFNKLPESIQDPSGNKRDNGSQNDNE